MFAHIKDGQGFFVESGARDGEAHSNTLYYENTKKWTGLLVEPSPVEFPGILKTRRHSWAFFGGLATTSPKDTVSTVKFEDTAGGLSKTLSKVAFLEFDAGQGHSSFVQRKVEGREP